MLLWNKLLIYVGLKLIHVSKTEQKKLIHGIDGETQNEPVRSRVEIPRNSATLRSQTDTWWGHQMETFSALLAPCVGQWCEALMFSLIWAWINGWVNNRKTADWRRHRGHYDVTVMITINVLFNSSSHLRFGRDFRCVNFKRH